MSIRTLLGAGLLAAPLLAAAAAHTATLTLVDGRGGILIRDTSTYGLAEGVRLAREDILDTGPDARLMRLEFSDGSMLDLGPNTRVLLNPKFDPKLSSERGKAAPRCYLLEGWVKYSAPGKVPQATVAVLSSAEMDVSTVAHQAVVSQLPQATYVFAEAGTVTLTERQGGRAQSSLTLKPNEFYVRTGNAKSSVTNKPTASFLSAVPRPFLDTLPSRLAKWEAREVQPKALGGLSYASAQPWVDAEAALRPLLVARWKSLAQQPAFRAELARTMPAHPEWDRWVYPEKYRPKPRPADTAASSWPRAQ